MKTLKMTMTALGTAAALSMSVVAAYAMSTGSEKAAAEKAAAEKPAVEKKEPVKVAAAEPEKKADAAAGTGGPFKTEDGALVVEKGVAMDEGRWRTEEGAPSYKMVNGETDWGTYQGFRRYHAECHTCHGPEGLGSSYAPNLTDSLKKLSYEEFQGIIASGQKNVWGRNNSIMPALGDNKNVWCYVDDIYTYLKARSDGALPRGRPKRWENKPEVLRETEAECLG